MVTALGAQEEKVKAIEAGADDFLTKPVNQLELLARVKSLLRIKEYHDTIQDQAAQLAEWNWTLETRVQRQVEELERLGRLRRFLAPQLAEMIVSDQQEQLLESHRREITVVFCDLRGFTAFAETTEPEEVMEVLREFHTAMGELIFRYEGTLERFAGDGMMIFFNDPLPRPDHAERAVRMAVAMRARVGELLAMWRRRGHQLDFAVGVALGYATLGKIGFEGRFDYAAIGTVTNLASRLCDEAKGGQILISQRIYSAVEGLVVAEALAELTLKGFSRPVAVYNVMDAQQG
jgi:class 3 adenylate cyclase